MADRMPLLLVVSHEQLRRLVRKVLVRNGFTLIEVADARAALTALEMFDGGFALMIVDEDLPQMSGQELTKHGNQAFPGVPLLLMATLEPVRDCAGADLLLSKPFQPAELIDAVRGLLEGPTQ